MGSFFLLVDNLNKRFENMRIIKPSRVFVAPVYQLFIVLRNSSTKFKSFIIFALGLSGSNDSLAENSVFQTVSSDSFLNNGYTDRAVTYL